METRTEIRRRLRTARDWAVVVQELEREVETLTSQSERSDRLYEIGLLAEEVIPDRERALGLFARAFDANPKNVKVLGRMRSVYREMGRLELVVACGERELDGEVDQAQRAKIAAEVGEALLDMGQRDKAVELLEQAIEVMPDSMPVRDALAAANYDRDDWIAEVEKLGVLAEKADSMTAARMCLRAARILNMEMPDDAAYEQTLRRVLSNDPQNESANYLYEAMLAKKSAGTSSPSTRKSAPMPSPASPIAPALPQVRPRVDRSASRTATAAPPSSPRRSRPRTRTARTSRCVARWLPSRSSARSSARARSGEPSWRSTDQALAAKHGPAGEDEKLYAGLLGGVIAWKELGDKEKARGYFELVKQIEPQNPVLGEFLADGAVLSSATPVAEAALGGTTDVAIRLPEAEHPRDRLRRAEGAHGRRPHRRGRRPRQGHRRLEEGGRRPTRRSARRAASWRASSARPSAGTPSSRR